MFEKIKKLRNAYREMAKEKTPEDKNIVNISDIEEKTSRTIGIDQEFNYAVASAMLGAQGVPQPKKLQSYTDYTKLYGESVWVYACVYQISVSIAGVPLVLYKKTKGKNPKLERIEDSNHDIMKVLNRPNMYMSRFDLMEAIVANLELTGNSYIEEVKSGNTPVELYPLQSQKVKIIPSKTDMIFGYKYEDQGKSVIFNEDEITHIRWHNPISDFYGASPLTPAELATRTDVQSAQYNKSFFDNSARPDAVLETEQTLNDKIVRRLRTQFLRLFSGVKKAHGVGILEGGLKYRQIALSQKEMDFILSRKMNREEIFAAFGIHPALFGMVDRINNSVMQNIRRNFWENTLVPKMEKIMSSLNYNLVLPFDENLVLMFDMDSIESLKESRETRAKIAAVLVDRGIFTINEIRKDMFNKEPVAWGSTWHMPLNLMDVDKIGAGQPPGNPIGRQPVSDEGKNIYPSIIDENGNISLLDYGEHFGKGASGEIDAKDVHNPFPVTDTKDSKQRKNRKQAFAKTHEQIEEEFTVKLNELFKRQAKKVASAIAKGKKFEELEKIIDSDKKTFRAEAEKLYEKIMLASGNYAMEELKELIEKLND